MGKIQNIEKLFLYLLLSFLLLPLAYLFCKVKRDRLIILLAVYGLVFFLFLKYYYDFPKSFRQIQQALYTLLEYTVFTYVIAANIRNPSFKKAILFLSILFAGFLIVYLFISRLDRIDSVPVGVETILILIYIIAYFQQYFKFSQTSIYNDANFYLVSGILLYLGGNFFFNILANQMSKQQWDQYWNLTYIPEIIKNSLFAVSILLYKGRPRFTKENKSPSVPYLDLI